MLTAPRGSLDSSVPAAELGASPARLDGGCNPHPSMGHTQSPTFPLPPPQTRLCEKQAAINPRQRIGKYFTGLTPRILMILLPLQF